MRLSIGLILIIGSFAWLHAGTVHPSAAEAEQLNATIGQMIMLEFKINAPQYLESGGGDHRAATADMLDLVEQFQLGGIVIDDHNDAVFLDPDFALVRTATTLDGLRPFVAVNEEGGAVQIPSETWFDHQAIWIGCTSLGEIRTYQARYPDSSERWDCPDHTWSIDRRFLPFLRNAHLMGTMWTPAETEARAGDIGRALAKLNITMNLGPVLGVSDGTSDASFLGDRTFADDPGKVAEWARAFSQGIRKGSGGRVATVVKHFPGLGSVVKNTGHGSAVTPPLAALVERDLLPYERPIADYYSASGVMMSNASVPGLSCESADTNCRTPATLSKAAYALLRGQGWNGLVITDTLQTPAVTNRRDAGQILPLVSAEFANRSIVRWSTVERPVLFIRDLTWQTADPRIRGRTHQECTPQECRFFVRFA